MKRRNQNMNNTINYAEAITNKELIDQVKVTEWPMEFPSKKLDVDINYIGKWIDLWGNLAFDFSIDNKSENFVGLQIKEINGIVPEMVDSNRFSPNDDGYRTYKLKFKDGLDTWLSKQEKFFIKFNILLAKTPEDYLELYRRQSEDSDLEVIVSKNKELYTLVAVINN